MPVNIWLYAGEATQANIKLSDPTVIRSGSTNNAVARSINLGALVMGKPTAAVYQPATARGLNLGALIMGMPTAGGPAPQVVEWVGQTVKLELVNDFFDVKGVAQSLVFSHDLPVMTLILDRDDNELFRIRTSAGNLTRTMEFGSGVIFDGIKVPVLTGGVLMLYLKP